MLLQRSTRWSDNDPKLAYKLLCIINSISYPSIIVIPDRERHCPRYWRNIAPMLTLRLLCLSTQRDLSLVWNTRVSTIHWPNVALKLGHRLRRWPNINLTLGRCVVFALTERLLTSGNVGPMLIQILPSKHKTFTKRRFNVGPPSATLAQHWTIPGVFFVVSCVGYIATNTASQVPVRFYGEYKYVTYSVALSITWRSVLV